MRIETRVLALSLAAALAAVQSRAGAATLDWKGHTWQLTSGGMAGVCQGDPANVTVDASGYLHLRLSHDGSTWSAAELFTTDRLGFGTYQWQVDGRVDTLDKNVVLGLFPYGPQAGVGSDGTNEIDIEYSRWGETNGPNGDFTDYPASGDTQGELSFTFMLQSSLSTSRFVWSSSNITDFLFDGLKPIDQSASPLKTFTYSPAQPTTNIPQQPLPLGMNLWCFDSPPSDGNPVELVIRDFQFVAEGTAVGAAGAGPSDAGAAGDAGTGAIGGMTAAAGAHAGGRNSGFGGRAASAGAGAGASGGIAGNGVALGGAGGSGAAAQSAGGSVGAGGATHQAGQANGGEPSGATSRIGSQASGCGCRLASTSDKRGFGAVAAMMTAGLMLRRRRRQALFDTA